MYNSSLRHKGILSNSLYTTEILTRVISIGSFQVYFNFSHLSSQWAPFLPIAITAKDHLANKPNILQSQHWIFTWQFLGLLKNEL